ncbi:hypothetical protein [Cyclobacterium roseum]|uniref:hypothetical protein n=1 Tax=Cyclobacterium roseum TaxID=2666137 RepID=UPI001390980E|nr:hypothetical protein [Cyclobacterium roseum]
MVIIEVNNKLFFRTFNEIKRVINAAKSWKVTTRIEITVLDGRIQLIGRGFVKDLEARTTGSCKLVVPVVHWYEIIKMSKEKILKVVITEGEAMVGRVTVNVPTTFFENDKILRSISLAANPKAIDYWKLEYQGYTPEELEFHQVNSKIEWAKSEFDKCIGSAAYTLSPFRITKKELMKMVLQRLREKEKIDFEI